MKKHQHIENIAAMLAEVVEKSKRAYEKANDGNIPESERKIHEERETRFSNQIDSFFNFMGVRVYWPGLYPTFQVPSGEPNPRMIEVHRIEDALSLVRHGMFFSILKDSETILADH